MHPPEKEGAHRKTWSAGQKISLVPAIYETSDPFATEFAPAKLQVDRLIRRFSLTPPVARAVALLAYGRAA